MVERMQATHGNSSQRVEQQREKEEAARSVACKTKVNHENT